MSAAVRHELHKKIEYDNNFWIDYFLMYFFYMYHSKVWGQYFIKKLTFLFTKDALHCLKLTVKPFVALQIVNWNSNKYLNK